MCVSRLLFHALPCHCAYRVGAWCAQAQWALGRRASRAAEDEQTLLFFWVLPMVPSPISHYATQCHTFSHNATQSHTLPHSLDASTPCVYGRMSQFVGKLVQEDLVCA